MSIIEIVLFCYIVEKCGGDRNFSLDSKICQSQIFGLPARNDSQANLAIRAGAPAWLRILLNAQCG